MSAFHDNALMGASGSQGYQISRSVRLRSSASAYFNRTPASATNRQTWTWSAWVKLGNNTSDAFLFSAGTDANNTTSLKLSNGTQPQISDFTGGGTNALLVTSQVLRDPSAWYHLVVVYNTTSATSSNRIQMYLNGVQITSFSTATYPSQNYSGYINTTNAHNIGRSSASTAYFDGYLTEVNFIDGQALTPSSFGENDSITGVWKPKKYAGTYGTNGFYLNFSDNSNNTAATIGKDYSGNGNNWTPNNISVTSGSTYDSMLDVPTLWADGGNGRGNYSVLSPIDKYSSTIGTSEANLKLISTSGGSFQQLRNTIGMTSGKYYMEWVIVSLGAAGRTGAALIRHDSTLAGASTSTTTSWCYSSTGDAYANNVTTSLSTGAITTGTDVVMYAFDADTGKFWMGKNGTWANSGDPATGANPIYSGLTNGPYFFGGWNYNTSDVVAFNFGQRPFSYTPPSGFVALNTQNLPDSTIKAGNKYMDVAIQTGNTTGRTVSGLAFQPDLVWVKNRAGSTNRRWGVIDSVRGVNKTLTTQYTDAEVTSQTDLLTAFNSDGFTIGADAGLYGWNGFAESYVHFVWKAGNGSSSNTSGSITSTVSVNATAGFSIATFTSQSSGTGTFGHSLGVAPSMVILKLRATTSDWFVYHSSLGATKNVRLNLTDSAYTQTSPFNDTAPTSTLVTLGTAWAGSLSMVAYCWAAVPGYSAFGSYTGNGSADGPFVFCGFRPRFILAKSATTSATNWFICDTARSPENVSDEWLLPNGSNAEQANVVFDILSNGFKLRASTAEFNTSGSTYIFAAFAENPFKLSLAR